MPLTRPAADTHIFRKVQLFRSKKMMKKEELFKTLSKFHVFLPFSLGF